MNVRDDSAFIESFRNELMKKALAKIAGLQVPTPNDPRSDPNWAPGEGGNHDDTWHDGYAVGFQQGQHDASKIAREILDFME